MMAMLVAVVVLYFVSMGVIVVAMGIVDIHLEPSDAGFGFACDVEMPAIEVEFAKFRFERAGAHAQVEGGS